MADRGEPLRREPVPLDSQLALIASGHAFSVCDARDTEWPLVWVNPAFEKLTGYSLADVEGRSCRLLQGERSDPAAAVRIRAALSNGESVNETLLNYRKDGVTWWNEVTIRPVRDASGELTHFVGVQSDVSARVQSDNQRDAARAEAEAATSRLRLLAEAGAILTTSSNPADAFTALLELLVPTAADWCSVVLIDGIDSSGPTSRVAAYRSGADTSADAPRLPEQDEVLWTGRTVTAQSPAGSLIVVPLVDQGETVGCLTLAYSGSGRQPSPLDVELATELGLRLGAALETMHLHHSEHHAALTLQHSLLPTLPRIAGLSLAARYLPGSELAEVGGDWYDVLALPDGATGIAIGDVMGHDMRAAAAMGELRSVLRSYAWEGHGPAGALDRVNALVSGLVLGRIATCVYARLEPRPEHGSAVLRWANAGHLPPLLKTPDGQVQLLTEALSPLIGVRTGLNAIFNRPDASVAMAPGTTLLLYTDGLVESRDHDIDVGIKRLRDAFATAPASAGMDDIADRLTAAIGRSAEGDDQCLLLVHIDRTD